MKNPIPEIATFLIYSIVVFFVGFNLGNQYSGEINRQKNNVEFVKRPTKFEYLKNDLDRISRSSDKSERITNEHLAHVLYIMLHELEMQQKQIDKLDSLQ